MNRKFVIPAAILLIAGAVAIAILKSKDPEDPAIAKTENSNSRPEAGRSESGGGAGPVRSSRTNVEPSERESRERELVEEYGRVRTAQAREVSGNMVSILEDVVAVGEMMMSGGEQFGGRRGMVNGITRRMGIELNDEQQDKALALYDEWQKSELEKSKKAIETLRTDPTAMMELFLAGDAKERGDLSDDEYAALVEGAAGRLEGVINPLDRSNFRGGRMSGDDGMMDRFAGILDPEQKEKFSTYREEQASGEADNSPRQGNITAMPAMELDTLGGAITGAKKMTSGFRTVMEGMGSLRELRPQIEPEAEGN